MFVGASLRVTQANGSAMYFIEREHRPISVPRS